MSICLHLSEWHICIFCPILIVVSTLRHVSRPKNEMNYLSHNIDWIFECRRAINIPNKYSKKSSEVKTSKQRSIKIRETMLPDKHKIRGFPLLEDLMSSHSNITLSGICVLFQVAVIFFVMLCKCFTNELRTYCFKISLLCAHKNHQSRDTQVIWYPLTHNLQI